MLEMKTEVQTDDAEPEPAESKGEPRSEMMEEDLQGSSQVKEETDTTEQKSDTERQSETERQRKH